MLELRGKLGTVARPCAKIRESVSSGYKNKSTGGSFTKHDKTYATDIPRLSAGSFKFPGPRAALALFVSDNAAPEVTAGLVDT